jgi:hypothetical protein
VAYLYNDADAICVVCSEQFGGVDDDDECRCVVWFRSQYVETRSYDFVERSHYHEYVSGIRTFVTTKLIYCDAILAQYDD